MVTRLIVTDREALEAINTLRSNIVATQSASWSNTMYPLVAILNEAGMEVFESSEEQMAEHYDCYGGAGGFPGKLQREPGYNSKLQAKHRMHDLEKMKQNRDR